MHANGTIRSIVAAVVCTLLASMAIVVTATASSASQASQYIRSAHLAVQVQHAELQASIRIYVVRKGDTLSEIAFRYFGHAGDWAAIYDANRGVISNPNVILQGWRLTIPRSSYAPPVTAGPKAIHVSASTTGGTLGCSDLESLWESAGGSSAEAFTAAEIAMAESGGRQYAHSPTNDYGYWQINGSHGPAEATFNAEGNARAAVMISSDGRDWAPWTTYTSGAYRGKCGGTSLMASVTYRATSSSSLAARALSWAYSQSGARYAWGGTSYVDGYDCSGLVMEAYLHVGASYFGRSTFNMLGSGHLIRVLHPEPGDFAFFGSGHVELYVRPGVTFGAQTSGTRVGFHDSSSWWHPTSFYELAA